MSDKIAKYCKEFKKYMKIAAIVFFILFLMSLGINDKLKDISFFNISTIYKTIVAIMPQALYDVLDKYRVQLGILDVVVILLTIVAHLYKPQLGLICHTSMSPDIATVNAKMLSEYHSIIFNIELAGVMENNNIVEAMDMQDTKVKSIIKNRKGQLLGYYGIAHTPLIFRMGYHFGDQNNIKLFHKKRNNSSCFEEWTHDSSLDVIRCKEKNQGCKSEELVVSVSTSFEIKENELVSLNKSTRHLLMCTSNNLSFDEIYSYVLADAFRNQIMTNIRDVVKKHGITTIHMAISSSVAFTFFLAAAFSRQHDPTIIVYHYENGKYIWGINMSLEGESAIVLNE